MSGGRVSELELDLGVVFRTSPNPYVILSPEFEILDMNAAYLAATGRTREALIGRSMFEAFPAPEEPQRLLRQSLEAAVRTRSRDTLALIRYPVARSAGDAAPDESLYWSATHTPILGPDGEVAAILQHTVDVTELQQLRAASAGGPALDAMAGQDLLRRAEAAQREKGVVEAERRRLAELFNQAPGFVAVLGGPDHVFEMTNQAYNQLIGHRPVNGKPVAEALPEVVAQGFVKLLDQVLATGEPVQGRAAPVRLQRTPGGEVEEVFLDFLYQPIRDETGRGVGVFVQGHEVTEAVLGQRRQKLLVDELNHRVKNTLATVQSIALQTLRSHPDQAAFAEAFQSRLLALSHTHDLLTRNHWDKADLAAILAHEAAPYGADRLVLEGPPVSVGPRAALALGMAVHELATNAAKYGALSVASGVVTARWSLSGSADDQRLILDWTESGGPPVAEPARKGFGGRLIELSIRHDLAGEVSTDYAPDGLRVRIEAPLPRGRP